MTDPEKVQVHPPYVFDNRSWEHWTADELMLTAEKLDDLANDAVGDERDRLLAKASDAMRCLGSLCLLLAPPESLMKERNEVMEEVRCAADGNSEYFAALTRKAEIERACGAHIMGYARKYRDGSEPAP